MDITTLTSIANYTTKHVMNASNTTVLPVMPSTNRTFGVICKVVYAIGIIANTAAIIALRIGKRRVRNRKHSLLLTSLAVNDLVALVGMVSVMLLGEHVPGVRKTRMFCGMRVVLRVFGMGSVCIAVTMALERFLALTRPFLYQKQVTYDRIRLALLVSWVSAAVLTCAPMVGIGLYYDNRGPDGAIRCARYRHAIDDKDVAYAVFYIILGSALGAVLVYCNAAVIRALYAISAPRGPPAVRRVSRRSCPRPGGAPAPAHHNAATAEEVAFSRVMFTLSVLFIICWVPQMVMTGVFLALSPKMWHKLEPAGNACDILMLLNYVLDPFLYVHLRQRCRLSPSKLCHAIANCFKRNHKTSTESVSMKTSCCAQDTVVVSDSSGAEMRPLRGPCDHPDPTQQGTEPTPYSGFTRGAS